ncbi:uncharacterized protein F5Z01DRAFT_693339 [Emericellopsis atlantica]|uniref:Uncharacterized protein n=1 Tax=Emericellopsis atlantica TaxID=2614577 RepID=A0A9P7ZFA2_9HYPO|nr:uncharacterized protein F5Z01DRAFT_693339 [Emericellopsis atlantica]KAG9251019.1 hypothetical protein F5Z01DRAFT_693339 [Emericellopsis atlantica]
MAASDANMTELRPPTGPRQPTRQEVRRYYWGLPSQPLLIARSSTTPWDMPRYYKSLIPAGRHDALAAAWQCPLKSRIISCLDGKAIRWLSFFPIKIGDFEDQHTQSLVLLISVDEEHMPQWNFGINNVECEMMATSWFPLTNPEAPAKLEALNAKHAERTTVDFSKFIPFPGAAIDSADNTRNSTDTLGLTVRITKRPTELWLSKWQFMTKQEREVVSPGLIETEDVSFIAALTCNHCVQSRSKSEFDPVTMRYDVHLPSAKYLHEWIEKIDHSIAEQSDRIVRLEDGLRKAGWSDSEEHQACVPMEPRIRRFKFQTQIAKAALSINSILRDYTRPFEPRSVRTLGRVLYTPPIGLDEGRKTISDWALLEIFEDKVEAGHQWNLIPLFWDNVVGMATLKAVDPTLHKKSSMQLQSSILPKSELRRGIMAEHDSLLSRNPESRQYVLGKYGAATGLTFGYCNDFKAVTRRPVGPEHISEEYFIVGLPDDQLNSDKATRFSKRGDSGAVVWNLDGRPVGMLTSGEGYDGVSDITYMTHLEGVFGMMADRGFEISIVD